MEEGGERGEGSKREERGMQEGCSLMRRERTLRSMDSLSTLEVNVEGCERFQSNKKVHNASCVAIVRAIVKLAQGACGIFKLLISVCVCVCVYVCVWGGGGGGGREGQMRLIQTDRQADQLSHLETTLSSKVGFWIPTGLERSRYTLGSSRSSLSEE